jgi:hypothetical protein
LAVKKAVGLAPSDQVKDPYDFLVPPPAPKGSVSIAGRVDVALKSHISHVIASQKFPFKNESDLVRAAVYRFMDRDIAPFLDQNIQDDFRRMQEVIRQNQAIARVNAIREFCAITRKSIETLMGDGAKEAAVQVYLNAEDYAEKSNEPLRTKVLDYLRTNIELNEVIRLAEDWKAVKAA